MPLIPFHKPRREAADTKMPIARRVVWEHFGDVRIFNTWLLALCCIGVVALLVMGSTIFILATRPPVVLSEDDGVILWRNTEVFRLREDNVRMFHEITLGRLLNYAPTYYDLSPILPLLHPSVAEAFTSNARLQGGARLRSDKRQVYSLYEVRRTTDPRYPRLLVFVTRGEVTIYEERRDSAGNIRVFPESEIAIWVTYLEPVRPSPDNPWAFRMVGAERREGARGEEAWNQSFPVAGSTLPDGSPILPAKERKSIIK